jgi:signal transduction histidine kinase
MASTGARQLRIAAREGKGTVTIRFEDTGTGIASPENLFRPFQRGAESSGLGLYVSRAIMRSFGGELSYEPASQGCCFAVILPLGITQEAASD